MSASNFPTVTDRSVQYPSRVTLTNVSGDVYDVTAAPGTVTAEGTLINAELFESIRDDSVWAIENGGTGATTAAAARAALDVPATSQLTAEQNARIAADADLSDDISDLNVAVSAKYTKPSTGIPKTDLASAVQEELIPSGGTTGQVLKKASGTDYDVEWGVGGSSVPAGGTQYQVLAKSSSTDYDATWMGKAVDYNDYSGSASVPALPVANGGTGASTPTAACSNLGAPYTTKQTATIQASAWNQSTKTATCSISGLRVDSDTTQYVGAVFTDNATMLTARPWFSCSTAGTLTVKCLGTVPTTSVVVLVLMQEV